MVLVNQRRKKSKIKELTLRKPKKVLLFNQGKEQRIYTDYCNGQVTATGLSLILDKKISHGRFTQILREAMD